MDKIQEILDNLNRDNVSIDDIEKFLASGNISIKVNAIMATIRLNIHDDKIIQKLSQIAQNIDNEPRVIGIWNGGHFALAALKFLNTEKSETQYKQISAGLKESQQEALERLLIKWPQ